MTIEEFYQFSFITNDYFNASSVIDAQNKKIIEKNCEVQGIKDVEILRGHMLI